MSEPQPLTLTAEEAIYLVEGLNRFIDHCAYVCTRVMTGVTEPTDHDIAMIAETMARVDTMEELHDRLMVIAEAGGFSYTEDGTLIRQAA